MSFRRFAALPLMLSLLGWLTADAGAQPSQAPPLVAPPAPCGVCMRPPASYPTLLRLSKEEQELLAQGEISNDRHAGGALMAFLFGFGTGQAVQGRWGESGWIFTIGETLSLAAIIHAAPDAGEFCDSLESVERTAFERNCDARQRRAMRQVMGGLAVFVGLHLWEVVDAINGPRRHNRRVRHG
mgnify:CR=1 FL=1